TPAPKPRNLLQSVMATLSGDATHGARQQRSRDHLAGRKQGVMYTRRVSSPQPSMRHRSMGPDRTLLKTPWKPSYSLIRVRGVDVDNWPARRQIVYMQCGPDG